MTRAAAPWLVFAALVQAAPAAAQQDAPRGEDRALFGLTVEAFGALPVDASNRELFGLGGGGALDVELNVHALLGVTLGFSAGAFSSDQSPQSTEWVGGRVGPRFHWGVLAGAVHDDGWLDAHFNFGSSGGIRRGGFDVGVGYGFSLTPGLRLGPFFRYQFDSDPLDRHAQLLILGISVGVFGDPRADVPAPPPSSAGPIPANPDMDGDGVLNEEDVCPATPAGASPDPARAGCPASDADSDGVFDVDDVCPMEPAGARPDPQSPGCPLRDQDHDGIIDRDDHCPDVAQGASPDPARPGCPAGDRDGDGVQDPQDRCPDVRAGPHPDAHRPGCPLPDRDNDSVPDTPDACPDVPGAPSPDPQRNGCPGLVRVSGSQIQIMRPVFFENNSDQIRESSRAVLQAVVDAISALGIRRLRIEGHTDSVGREEYNLDLSRRRAQSVLRAFVEGGVSAEGLEAVGFGETRPIADNATAEGRAQNRRVELHILDAVYRQAGSR